MRLESLTPIEEEVYHILQDEMKKNQQFSVKAALPILFKEIGKKYPQKDISIALTSLMKKKYIIRGSSLSRDDILTNSTRKEIFKFIQVNPGAYNRLIRRELNLGSNEFNWHIGMLLKFEYIKKMEFSARFGFYENRSFMDHEYDLFLLQNDKVKGILEQLEKGDGTVSQIASNIDMHYSTVRKYMIELARRKIVNEKPIANKKISQYTVNDELLIKIRKIINGQIFVEFA